MLDEDLETPGAGSKLYAYTGVDAQLPRALFTGDIFEVDGTLRILVQHPCALRAGPALLPTLLTAEVHEVLVKPRSDWKQHRFSEMPLPGLFKPKHFVADFHRLAVIETTDAPMDGRVAILSQEGVNLLSQRWVYHNSRVVVPTQTFDMQTFGPYNEADLYEEWVSDHPNGIDAVDDFDRWIRDGDPSRQSMLNSTQSASAVRRDMRLHLKSL